MTRSYESFLANMKSINLRLAGDRLGPLLD